MHARYSHYDSLSLSTASLALFCVVYWQGIGKAVMRHHYNNRPFGTLYGVRYPKPLLKGRGDFNCETDFSF